MTFAYWCLPIAMFLPLIWAGVAKANGVGKYDNSKPREWLEKQDDKSKRSNWAQQNSYEAFPPFAAAVIVAHLTGSAQMTIDALAGAFILARIAYGVCYIADKPMLRSIAWSIGFAATLALFII